MPNIFYKFVHLQLFNIKHKIVHLQFVWRQIFFQKSCLSQTEENGCLWTYGRASLVSDFKLTQENDDLLSSRHKYIFEVPHPVQEYTKMQIPDKRNWTNLVCTFWGTRSPQLWDTLVQTISVGSVRKLAKYIVRLWN